jgi:hypothetical protein
VAHLEHLWVRAGQRLERCFALHRRKVQVGPHQVAAFLREEDQVARRDLVHLAAVHMAHLACTLGEKVEEGDLVGTLEAVAHALQSQLAADAPGRRELGVQVHRSLQVHGLQDV